MKGKREERCENDFVPKLTYFYFIKEKPSRMIIVSFFLLCFIYNFISLQKLKCREWIDFETIMAIDKIGECVSERKAESERAGDVESPKLLEETKTEIYSLKPVGGKYFTLN